MKKNILLEIVVLLMLFITTGCSKTWEKHFEVSKLKIEANNIAGKIKNKDEEAYKLKLLFDLKNGSISDQKECNMIIRPNETIELDCTIIDHNDFDVKLSTIEFEKIEIPALYGGKIDDNTLEYYFYDVYKNHKDNFILFTLINDEFYHRYPYMDQIEYIKEDNLIFITGTVTKDYNFFSYKVNYNSYTGEIENIQFFFRTKDEKIKEDLINNIAISSFRTLYKDNSKEILEILNENIPEEKCHIFKDEWCISSIVDNDKDTHYYYIKKR